MTILIVDNDMDDVLFFRDALAEIDPGIQSMMAFNGIEALQKLETAGTKPDFIFLDLNMPKMDGKQCLKHLKNNPLFQPIPVIIYSTNGRPEDKEEMLALGAASYVVKPNRFQLLKSEIQAVLDGHRITTAPNRQS
ncbi:MAG TPA: response regulator [Puia sp.]|jgi:CheY-like chemotaxis protein|nr:response regulator [Puia sp.]